MSHSYDVLVIGELNLDLILDELESFPEIGKEKLAHKLNLTLGSSSAIFACNLSALNTKVSFIGKIGDDDLGQMVIDSLQEKGVDTSLILKANQQKTGITIVLNNGNDRAMVTYPGAMEVLNAGEIDDARLQLAKHLHISSVFLQPGLKSGLNNLLQRAKKAGMTTSLDPQWDPAETWDLNLKNLLPNIDIFLPNEQEFLMLTHSDTITDGIKRLPDEKGLVVIKRGESGSMVIDDDKIYNVSPFFNNDVVDAIGAGDSFNAGFVHKFIQKEDPATCAKFGSIMGAINTTASGGTNAFSDYRRIMKLAEEKFSYNT